LYIILTFRLVSLCFYSDGELIHVCVISGRYFSFVGYVASNNLLYNEHSSAYIFLCLMKFLYLRHALTLLKDAVPAV